MADAICTGKPPLAKPGGYQNRRRARLNHRRPAARLDSAIYLDEHHAPARGCQDTFRHGGDGRGRTISRRRFELDTPEWAAGQADRAAGGGAQLLPRYSPKPLLHREDAFKVIEEPAAATALTMPAMLCASAPKTGPGLLSDDEGDSTEYDSDELELGTTQFPEFGEGIFDDCRPQRDYSYESNFSRAWL